MFFSRLLSSFFPLGRALSKYLGIAFLVISGIFASEKYLGFKMPYPKEYVAAAMLASFIVLHLIYLLIKKIIKMRLESRMTEEERFNDETSEGEAQIDPDETTSVGILKSTISRRFGRFWRSKIKIISVVGSPELVTKFLPGLIEEGWQISDKALLIWGGNADEPLSNKLAQFIKSIDKSPLDSIVWAVKPEELDDIEHINYVSTYLYERESQLKWRAPLFIWSLNHTLEPISHHQIFPIGTFLPKRASERSLESALKKLILPLTKLGANQIVAEGIVSRYSYLLQLAKDIDNGGANLISSNLSSFFSNETTTKLRGVFFGPIADASINDGSQRSRVRPVHSWFSNPAWDAIISANSGSRGQAIGANWEKGVQFSLLSLLMLVVAGSSVSYLLNKAAIEKLEQRLGLINQPTTTAQQRLAQQFALQQDIERIQYEIENGSSIITRFGLNRNQDQLNLLWKHYEYAVLPFIKDGAIARFESILTQWTELKAGSAKNENMQKLSYDVLKAYLMMADPQKADPKFLTHQLTHAWLKEKGVQESVWQTNGFSLLSFFATELPKHPEWAIDRNLDLVSQSRNALLREIGFNNAESALYQSILKGARNYPDLALDQLVGQTDYNQLYYVDDKEGESTAIPGIFTRQAYEGQIKAAIKKAVDNRQEDVDWVLSDNPKTIENKESPEALEARLKARYFTDFSYAWLNFLNKIRWVNSTSISQSIDQLSLIGDPRLSPVIALFDAIHYQSETGREKIILKKENSLDETLNSLLIDNAQQQSEVEQYEVPEAMAQTFGPLLNALDMEKNNSDISLQTYITRITRLRLKLQQAANTSNPDAVMRGIAQTVFQGTSIDLTDTRDFGHLMAESLGAEWSGLGQSIFVQPLEQTWQGVLNPSTNSINNQWKQAIVNEWNQAFQGRYPFTKSTNDSSMPLLGEFIRPNTGRIDQFITKQLAGVLQKEGNVWVPNALNTQGMAFNPEFLDAINQLNKVADIMYLTGDANVSFELLARPTSGITETQLMIDGQLLRYFNQVESWQPFKWPGNLLNTGTRLTWGAESGGLSILSEQAGTWGFIRLLSQASVKQLDSSTFQLTFKTDTGLPVVYILRTQIGYGPLELLKLRQFKIPDTIFITGGATTNSEVSSENAQKTAEPEKKNYTHAYNSIPSSWQGGDEDIVQASKSDVSEEEFTDESENDDEKALVDYVNMDELEEFEETEIIDVKSKALSTTNEESAITPEMDVESLFAGSQ